MNRKTAIVTGASSGIGEVTAERLAKAGYTVYGTSRRGATVGTRSFHMLSLDVTSDASVEVAVGEVMRREGRIDLLVNNAGFGVANEPGVVAGVVLKAANAERPKLRYPAGKLANRLRWLRRFAPTGIVDAGLRKDLRLDTPGAARLNFPVEARP